MSLPSVSDSTSHTSHRSSHASIALIVTSLFTFLLFVCLSIKRRPSRRAPPSLSITNDKSSAKRKPKLWEVCLDEDLTRLDGAVRNWQVGHHKPLSPRTRLVTSTPQQPITAWTNYRLGRRPRPPPPSPPEQLTGAWSHHAPPRPRPPPTSPPILPDHRTLNVAVLVAMPSRRPPKQPTHGIAPHHSHPIGSRLSYGEGQLLIGTTSVSCSRRVLSAALADQPRT
jgi:hypothetical protein